MVRLVHCIETKSNNGNLSGIEFLHAYLSEGGLGRSGENCCLDCGNS